MLATSYDGETTVFQHGGEVKSKRGKYKRLRQQLQKRGTRSARRRLKTIGDRENRWMTDVNHQASKALVNHYDRDTMFVLEDLTGIRNATEQVRVKDRVCSGQLEFPPIPADGRIQGETQRSESRVR